MLTELRKSIGYIIYERTTSPFWGAFVFSWLICNWKIWFVIFVVNEDKLSVNKIDYVSNNLVNWKPLILYPFISTLILVTIFPLLSNLAYWITIIYAKWRLDKKNEVEKKQLLSIEQSIEIRVSNRQIEENYNKLVSDKETEIKTLKIEIEELQKRFSEPSQVLVTKISENSRKEEIESWEDEYNEFKTSIKFNDFGQILLDVNTGYRTASYSTPKDSLVYFQSLELIKPDGRNIGFELTSKGLYFSKLYNKNKYELPKK